MSERERFEAWARGLAPEPLPLRKDPSGNYWSEETDTAWDAWQAALADRPAEHLNDIYGRTMTAPADRPEQPVAHLSAEHLKMAAGLMDDLKPIWLDINKPFFPRAVAADMYAFLNDLMATYTAPPSHPAPSEAGAVDLSYWCPFKNAACGDDPAKRCADCAQPAKGNAS